MIGTRAMIAPAVQAPTALLTAMVMASCALSPPEVRPALRALAIQQSKDGRFMACANCEPPTPKSLPGSAATQPADKVVLQGPTALPGPSASPVRTTPTATATAQRVERATLTFATGSAMLDASAQRSLLALRPLLAQASSLRIVGFTDDVGTQAANDQLADARALAALLRVRALLGDDSRNGPALSATGRGRCCYLDGNASERQRASNRRVELVLTFEDSDATDKLVARHARWLNQRTPAIKVTHDVRTHQ